MKPCPNPKCGVDQPDRAIRCSECDSLLTPPTGEIPIDPLSKELWATLQALQRELADLRQQLAAKNEKLPPTPAPPPPPTGTTAIGASAGVWGSAALIGLLKKWPRLATAATALMALGTAYGGCDLGRMFTQDPTTPATVITTDSAANDALVKERDELTTRVAAATKERDALSEQLAAMTKERDTLNGQAAAAIKERTDLATRVSGLESQLGAATKEIAAANAARDQALVREKAAMARAPTVTAPPPRPATAAGYVDLIVPRGVSTNADIVVQRDRSLLQRGGAWPTGDCTLVAGDPTARFKDVPFESVGNKRRTTAITGGTCNAAQIVVKKSEDWDSGDIVRLFWQLR